MRSLQRLFFGLAWLTLVGCNDKSAPSAGGTPTIGGAATSPSTPPSKGAGGDSPKTQNTPAASAQPDIAINTERDELEIKGQKITLKTTLADLEKLLGKPSSVDEGGFNIAAIWDELGLYILIRPETKTVAEITIHLGKNPRTYRQNYPKEKYSGKLTIDGLEIKKDSDIAEVARAKKGRPIKQMEGEDKGHIWKIAAKGRGPAVGIETEDDKGKGVRVVYYSF
jgi:hypothetical protein